MKDIRKIFNIKKNKTTGKNEKENSTFTIWEVVVVSITLAVFSSVLTGYFVNVATEKDILEDKQLRDIKETYKKIVDEYYEDVDKDELSDAAIDGMMDYLDENYSVHMNGTQTDELEDRLQGNYQGVGIEIAKIQNKVVVYRVFADTPAEKAGLQSGDIILEVEDLVVKDETALEEVTSTIVGKSKVNMTVLRNEEKIKLEIDVKNIEIPVVKSKIFERDDKVIGYLYLETFSANSYEQVRDALKKLEKEKIDSLVFDVRSNTGGYLNSAYDIASMFLKKGKVIYSLESKDEKTEAKDKTDEYRNIPIVVLIDSATASASEILAAALKESYGAVLIGNTSFGKGKVQQTNKLSNDTLVKYTTAKWFTPSGDSIDGIGLKPGIKVDLTEEYVKNPTDDNDTQLQKALEFLSKE